MHSGIHQLQCHTCHLCYIGQTGQNVENISDISPPITPIQHVQFTFSTTDMNMDPRTSPCSYSTQSTKVDEWTQLFHNIKPSSMNSPRKMKTPFMISSITYNSSTHAHDPYLFSPIWSLTSLQCGQQTICHHPTWFVTYWKPFLHICYNIQFYLSIY